MQPPAPAEEQVVKVAEAVQHPVEEPVHQETFAAVAENDELAPVNDEVAPVKEQLEAGNASALLLPASVREDDVFESFRPDD